jgi:hypothetical protein
MPYFNEACLGFDTLFTMALHLRAQAIGSVDGATKFMEVMPPKHWMQWFVI